MSPLAVDVIAGTETSLSDRTEPDDQELREYVRPTLVVLGNLKEITLGTSGQFEDGMSMTPSTMM